MKKLNTMKKLLLILLITLFIPKESYSQKKNNSDVTVAALTAIGAGLSIWAAVEDHKEYYESIATDFVITNYPQYKEFRLKVFQLGGKKGTDRGGMNVLPFSFVELKEGLPTSNRQLILLFTGSEKWNNFGIVYKDFAFKMINVSEWNEILTSYSQLSSPVKEDINDYLVPVFSLMVGDPSQKYKSNSEVEIISIKTFAGGSKIQALDGDKHYKRNKKGLFADIRELQISSKGLKKGKTIIYPFYNLRGDDYLVTDFSEQYKIIANEKSMGLYIKGAQESILIQRRLINRIHSFLNKLLLEEEE